MSTEAKTNSEETWKKLPKNMNNKLHTLCSYLAMFPPSLPHYFIEKYSNVGDIVLDPFSGRGTTLLESCFMGRTGVGNDKNPLAIILSKAKSHVPQKGRIVSRIEKLRESYNPNDYDIEDIEPKIKMIFSEYTLKQLLYLKKNLKWKINKTDIFITSMLLGIMHGNSIGYLSLSMPNTFSMSPNYVKNYIEKHNLVAPERNVFDLLLRKLNRCYQKVPETGKVYSQDARNMARIKDDSVNLIITSPPYLHVIRYGQYNWIRLWFFDQEGKEVDEGLFFSQSLDKYCDFMTKSLEEMKRTLKKGSKAVVVIGDVRNFKNGEVLNLAKVVWERCAEPLGFELVEPIIADQISDDKKVSRIWGKTKGNATKTDRILVLKKI